METAEQLLSQLRCGNIVEEASFSMSILDGPPLTIQWDISNNDAIKHIEARDNAIRAECAERAIGWLYPKNALYDASISGALKRQESANRLRAAIMGEEIGHA